MLKIDVANVIAERTANRSRLRPQSVEARAADLAKRYAKPMLKAWAATYLAASAEERETAAAAMRAEDRDSILGPAPRARLRAEVNGILRRAAERMASE